MCGQWPYLPDWEWLWLQVLGPGLSRLRCPHKFLPFPDRKSWWLLPLCQSHIDPHQSPSSICLHCEEIFQAIHETLIKFSQVLHVYNFQQIWNFVELKIAFSGKTTSWPTCWYIPSSLISPKHPWHPFSLAVIDVNYT